MMRRTAESLDEEFKHAKQLAADKEKSLEDLEENFTQWTVDFDQLSKEVEDTGNEHDATIRRLEQRLRELTPSEISGASVPRREATGTSSDQ